MGKLSSLMGAVFAVLSFNAIAADAKISLSILAGLICPQALSN